MAAKTRFFKPGLKSPDFETEEQLGTEETLGQIKSRLETISEGIKHGVTGINDGRKVVTTAGTRERLVGASTPAKYVAITAETDNTGVMAVGGATVVAALATRRGTPLSPGSSISLDVDDLLDVWPDSPASGDGATYLLET